jgi:hypothetical protein
MRPSPLPLPALVLAAVLAPGRAPAAAPTPASLSNLPVEKGAVLKVDLSRLPSSVALRATATCVGGRLTATGVVEEVPCQQAFTFEAPLAGDPVVVVFQPRGGGPPTRLEYPLARDPLPRTFTVPSAGTLSQPPPPPAKPGAAPPLPAALAAQARTAAAASCAGCRGAGTFALKNFTLVETPPPALEVAITVQPPAP